MEELFVPYDESVMLKELGFNEPCLARYSLGLEEFNFKQLQFHVNYSQQYDIGAIIPIENNFFPIRKRNSDYGYIPTAPLFVEAFKWFKDKYDLRVSFPSDSPVNYSYVIATSNKKFENCEFDDGYCLFKTQEEAELECLRKLIKLVESNKIYDNGIPSDWDDLN